MITPACHGDACATCSGQYVCHCLHVTEEMVIEAIAAGATTIVELRRNTLAGEGCTACHRRLREYLVEAGFCVAEDVGSRRELITV